MTGEVWTIGHSTRPPQALLDSLSSFGITVLIDVRRYPHSRRQPHYNADALRKTLHAGAIKYVYLGDELGGFRKPRPDSPHVALAGSSFQGYADHLDSKLFRQGVARLAELAAAARVACMCSERQPKDCHRRILSDFLVASGWNVHHILDAAEGFDHELSPKARWVEGRLVYAPAPLEAFARSDAGGA